MIKSFNRCKTIICFLSFLLLFACNKQEKSEFESFDPHDLDSAFISSIDRAYALFEAGFASEAADELMDIYQNEKNIYRLYLIHCYQSEILYYNNLPDQGFIITDLILNYANQLDDSLTKSSAFNFYGLHSLNRKDFQKAKNYFLSAKAWYPVGKEYPNQVKYFHILSNLAEAYLKIGDYDSTAYYVNESEKHIPENKYQRGHAINLWSLGQIKLLQKQPDSAVIILKQGIDHLKRNANLDIYQLLLASVVEAYNQGSRLVDPVAMIDSGLVGSVMENSNILAKVEFLNAAINYYLKKSDFKKASQLQSKLIELSREFSNTEQLSGAKLLSNFFQSMNALELEKKLKQNKENELLLSRALAISAFVLLILLGVIFYFIFKQGRVKQRLSVMEYKSKMSLINKQKEIEVIKARSNAILTERNRIARELHDDIGSSVSSILIYLSIAHQKSIEGKLEEAKEYIEKTIVGAKEISENVSDLVWAIYSKNDSFENLVNKMKQLAFDLFDAAEIEFDFDYPYSIKDLNLGLEERRNIYLIFKEIVNNALKYSKCSLFKVVIRQSPDGQLTFIFSDNGIGISETDYQQGNGLQTMKARARALNGKILLHTGENQGAIFTLTVRPNSDEHA